MTETAKQTKQTKQAATEAHIALTNELEQDRKNSKAANVETLSLFQSSTVPLQYPMEENLCSNAPTNAEDQLRHGDQ